MAQKFLQVEAAPVQQPVVDLKRGRLLTESWERWFQRLPDWILKRPSCHVYFTADQDIADSTWTDVLWSAEDHDNAAMHDTSTNTDRITVPSDGIYCAGAHVLWVGHATGARLLRITLNDAAPPAASACLGQANPLAASFNGNGPNTQVAVTRQLSAGDILRVAVYQSSGGALDATGTTGKGPFVNGFWCFKVSKAPVG